MGAPTRPESSAGEAASSVDDGGAADKQSLGNAAPRFRVLLRDLERPDSTGLTIEQTTPEAALRCALMHDVTHFNEPILKWTGREQAVALDFDREQEILVDPEEVVRFFPEGLPRPLAAWSTHDRGLRGLFVKTDGVSALELAAVWALLAPLGQLAGWRLEVKSDSRHPAGLRDGARCGRVHWFSPSANLVVPGNGTRSIASEAEIQRWLEEQGLSFGRHPTERCIWCGSKPASGSPAFVVDQRGIGCFRCSRRMSWDELLGFFVPAERPSLYEAAVALVHFPHQRHVLRDLRPSLPEELLRPAWNRILAETHRARLGSGDTEERGQWEKLVARAVSDHVDVVRGASGAWLDAQTLLPRAVSAGRTLKEMPWCRSGTMIDAADNAGPLRGFVAVQPIGPDEVIGPYVQPPAGSILVARPAVGLAPPPVSLGDKPPDPMIVDQAWIALERLLGGLHRGYLAGLIAARFFTQRGIGAPPIIAVTGGTNVGKTATQHLAAAATGTRAGIVRLQEAHETLRQIGLQLEQGNGLLFVDEVGRVPDLYRRLEPILALNSTVTYGAKYANERTMAMTAAVALLGSTLPMAIVRSPELSRRAVGWRLLHRTSNWDEDFGELGRARAHDALRQHLDLVTAAIWWKVHVLGRSGDWRSLCLNEFGAVPLSGLDLFDVEGAGRAEAICHLYEHFRNAPDAEIYNGAGFHEWLLANPRTAAGEILGELIDFDGDRRQTRAESAELQRLDLAPILGFSSPSLRLMVHRRSGRWLVKFVEEGVMRGRGRTRKQMPNVVKPQAAEPDPSSPDTTEREEVVL
jgi:hypothetical protein